MTHEDPTPLEDPMPSPASPGSSMRMTEFEQQLLTLDMLKGTVADLEDARQSWLGVAKAQKALLDVDCYQLQTPGLAAPTRRQRVLRRAALVIGGSAGGILTLVGLANGGAAGAAVASVAAGLTVVVGVSEAFVRPYRSDARQAIHRMRRDGLDSLAPRLCQAASNAAGPTGRRSDEPLHNRAARRVPALRLLDLQGPRASHPRAKE